MRTRSRFRPGPEALEGRRLPASAFPIPAAARPSIEVAAQAAGWRANAPLLTPRTEVAAALRAGEIVIIGGYLADGTTTGRVDAYSVSADRWRRLPDLPVAVNHAAAASDGRRVFVVGGYAGPDGAQAPLRAGYVLQAGRWMALPEPPEARAAAGAAIVGNRLYVVGGVGPSGLATTTLVYDIAARRWSKAPGPTPREHLAVAALGGRIYAVAGRRPENLDIVEVFTPRTGTWRSLAPVPQARGGTGLAVVGDRLVSVGGETPEITLAPVYALRPASNRWVRLRDLPTPRHGLGVVGVGGRVFAIAGGPRPGLFVSGVNESLRLV